MMNATQIVTMAANIAMLDTSGSTNSVSDGWIVITLLSFMALILAFLVFWVFSESNDSNP